MSHVVDLARFRHLNLAREVLRALCDRYTDCVFGLAQDPCANGEYAEILWVESESTLPFEKIQIILGYLSGYEAAAIKFNPRLAAKLLLFKGDTEYKAVCNRAELEGLDLRETVLMGTQVVLEQGAERLSLVSQQQYQEFLQWVKVCSNLAWAIDKLTVQPQGTGYAVYCGKVRLTTPLSIWGADDVLRQYQRWQSCLAPIFGAYSV